MADNDFERTVLALYHEKKWKEIIDLKDSRTDFEKLRLLWVWPSLSDLSWIKDVIHRRNLKGIVSIGCGSGLLEWLIQEYSGLEINGIEVDQPWWSSDYSPPLFLKSVTFIGQENTNINILPTHALLFCYFNNGPAFHNYMMNYQGNTVLVIGPGEGRGSHTDPTPFDKKFTDLGWKLDAAREIRNTKDHIAVYVR